MANGTFQKTLEAPSGTRELVSNHRLLLVANPLPFHVGGYLIAAAKRLGIKLEVSDIRVAVGSRLLQSFYWRFRDHGYVRQSKFTKQLLEQVEAFQPTIVLTIGICPVQAQTIQSIRHRSIRCVNFLTDDPFNKHHFCKWFAEALPDYDTIYTPRHANSADLVQLGCSDVRYLPFAYDSDQHYPEPQQNSEQQFDVLFVGGADEDRVPFIKALSDQGLKVLVLGGYWNRYPMKNVTIGGMATISQIRHYSAASKVAVILVRHNNRDGHVMRSFEAAAIGTCLAVEDTEEHRAIFGSHESGVQYFGKPDALVETVGKLLDSTEDRSRLAAHTLKRVRCWHNTYDARLIEIVKSDQRTTSRIAK